MKRILIITVALAATLLTGCGPARDIPAAAPQPTVTVTAAAPEPEETVEALSADDRFDEMLPVIAKETPSAGELYELRRLGHNTCDAIDRGVEKEDMISLMLSEGISPTSRTGRLTMAAMVVGTNVYCPEHQAFFLAS